MPMKKGEVLVTYYGDKYNFEVRTEPYAKTEWFALFRVNTSYAENEAQFLTSGNDRNSLEDLAEHLASNAWPELLGPMTAKEIAIVVGQAHNED